MESLPGARVPLESRVGMVRFVRLGATVGLATCALAPAARADEAVVGARGQAFRGTDAHGAVRGYVDAHLHITANQRAGGRVIYGKPFDPRGIQFALGDDASVHGADGSADVTGNLLRSGLPFGTHDTHGWPTFTGWPVYDTMTHQQTYYVWLERAWMAGLRLVVAQTVEDEPICRIQPSRAHTCNEPAAIRAQIRTLRGLQRYVDARSGGRGRGWFRLVDSPAAARRTIERGKLAVLIGIESSNPLGCSKRPGRPGCTAADVDRRLDAFHRLGVRTLFVAHWVNNAFAGAALEGGAKGAFINVFNRMQTGAWFETRPCPQPGEGEEIETLSKGELQVLASYYPSTTPIADEGMPSYPAGRQCNVESLTALGRHLIRALMARHMLIEVDHLSERAREQVLAMAERSRYPLVSSHTNTGGIWTARDLRRLYAIGGFATARPDVAAPLAARILQLGHFACSLHGGGVGLGTDTGGFNALPGPRADAATRPLTYPFRSHDGTVTFDRQQTGERTFDLNADGVAHYGLFADLLADMQRAQGGSAAARLLFRSAEAYLRTWRLAEAHH
jgi:microsomal dipeptidase-like Zn-dependent dipeptidase